MLTPKIYEFYEIQFLITKKKLPVDHKTIPAHAQVLQVLWFVNRECVKENMHEYLVGKNG